MASIFIDDDLQKISINERNQSRNEPQRVATTELAHLDLNVRVCNGLIIGLASRLLYCSTGLPPVSTSWVK